ncbi:MAG: type VI secretion system tip protein VgrG, partial [Salinisphaera sp.]|nr:type VI secretion system tip protein VgrG [Salinisphaera sp.]
EQAHRHLQLSTPLGPDVLVLRGMEGQEQLSAPFRLELDALSTDPAIDHKKLLGQNVTISLNLATGGKRYFNGFVSRFELHGYDGQFAHYRAVVVPWLWFLTRTSDCRIFQNKPIPTIIQEVFRENGFTDLQVALAGAYPPREYVTQYRETDFDFVSRLMEEEGIYYFFRHENGKHSLVLADATDAHQPCPGYARIPYYPPEAEQVLRDEDYVWDWRAYQQLRPGAFAQNDYDFVMPKKSLRTVANIARTHQFADFEMYDYPGGYTEKAVGDRYSKVRIEERQTDFAACQGQGNVRGLLAGGLCTLTNHPGREHNRQYLITAVTHHARSDAMETGRGRGEDSLYRCDFSAIDAKTPFRPPLVTPKGVVRGPQTATVVGKVGEEIWTDRHGRVKVQFHWDRYGRSDQNSSCWVRVSHPWAGKGWGSVHIPRIGQEVIVDFLEGDPDAPIITGRVYNGINKHPFALPAKAMVSGVKTNSTPRGGGYNEMSMDDTKGREKITIHGQYNMDTTVEHDQTNTVKNNQTIHVIADQSKTIDGNVTTRVGVNRNESIGANQTMTVTGNTTINCVGKVKIVGNGNVEIDGPSITLTATAQIKLAVGASSVTLTPASLEETAAMIKSNGTAMHDVQGGVVNITGGVVKVNS